MSQMDIDALKVLATAYKINSSTYNWLWVYRAGTVGSLGIALTAAGGHTPELFIGGLSVLLCFLSFGATYRIK